jgi:hypothetical protein
MRGSSGHSLSDCNTPIVLCWLANLGVAGIVLLAFLALHRPTVVPNPGMAAYKQPPGTYLIPPPQKMDAPEVADLPPLAAETAAASETKPAAKAKVAEAKTKHPKKHSARKRPQSRPRPDYGYPGTRYARQWDREPRSWGTWGGWSWN